MLCLLSLEPWFHRTTRCIDSIFGWLENGRLRRTRYRGRRRTQSAAFLVGAAYDLLRLARLRESVASHPSVRHAALHALQ